MAGYQMEAQEYKSATVGYLFYSVNSAIQAL